MSIRKENLLIVDDDYDMLEVLDRHLKQENYHTYKAGSVMEAIDILKHSSIDLLITDLQMPGMNGMELVKYVDDHYPEIPKLVITGYPSIDNALTAIKSGALDYLPKPFTKNELLTSVKKSLVNRTSTKKTASSPEIRNNYGGMVGSSAKFEELVDIIERVKNNRATILIRGESGTGKELVARAIHYKGSFAQNPFIAVNCGAIPENLLESELFGSTKGAYTGASETREGYFQAANGGTIFLDEIGTASLAVQVRLLRVLQEKEVRKLGGRNSEKIQVRVIAATNSDLREMVERGTFREDLYYRLNVVDILTPPLRERKEDIVPLTKTFLDKYQQDYGKTGLKLSDKTVEILKRYNWPGNIRELENVIQRAIIMSEDEILPQDLPASVKYQVPAVDEELVALKEVEKKHILKVLAAVDQNKSKAAEILQIDRKTLREKIK
ncbi:MULTISPECIES: sigma-54-dependent transcriptional regulator [Salegentibacter]|uniref:DNA-binding transcriptional response regulator, NtrC family, contains REC, AAA-type ATPase, and a Fis-type DNA-binding domains n=1 Tax=Salegentibacter agarivorans TaxID=345907 RepID=A0A1I2PUF8_9FLAO|nr:MULTISPECIES: sigma-54 dependent transcriptional regulator [Salegentibacter]APS38917.1 Fis family transcriptional regulator [Salegentibacter sp. T436]SFG17031.1 DNA-binding transcriptional response regulator, NtrC family, contains REC, AAA-type ATPase, and a Fis-type DNA-binding domains [Salegentibacter agarivorans]